MKMPVLKICPWCSRPLVNEADRSSILARNFCEHCDLPLFWNRFTDRSKAHRDTDLGDLSAEEAEALDLARRHRPGVAGIEAAGSVPCWNCGELNMPTATECGLCREQIPEPVTSKQQVSPQKKCQPAEGATESLRYGEPWTWLLVSLGILLLGLTTWFVVSVLT